VHFKMQSVDDMEPHSDSGSFLPLAILKENFLQSKAIEVLENEEDLIGQRLECSTPDGLKKVIRYSCVYVKLPGEEAEELDRLVLITEDITNEEGIREKMIQTNHLAGMGKMAASLVHEVNNPLAGIRLNLELLEMGLADEDKRKQVFHALSEGVERIDRIVKSFLSFARQEKPQKTMTNMQKILEGTLTMAVNFKQFHRVTIKTEYAEGLPQILADRYRLEQVFVNLLNNACDAMTKKGGVLRISTSQENDFMLIKFQDDGIGIKQEDLNNIFSPFFTTKERGYGTGLGLSTSYGIVHEHGGVIEVESREGFGSVFTIRLPLENNEEVIDHV
jgi:two-component system, NtrC family, sensor kinase